MNKLIDDTADWEKLWVGMPEYNHSDLTSWQSIHVHFRNEAERELFAQLIGRRLTDKTRSIWYPREEIDRYADKRYAAAKPKQPHYPIYIPSKGRWKSRLTAKALELIDVPYLIVVEKEEYKKYAAVIDPKKILVLPFSGRGLVPARNWIFEHAISTGAKRHWQLDDNISCFYRFNRNLKVPVADGTIFRAAEDFVRRYTNVAVAGFQYFMFASRKTGNVPAISLNTRVYSCSLINNSIPHRYRDVYNDDTDICLRALKDRWCTVLFNAFLCEKATTMTVKGGNTDIYQGDGRLKMAQSLKNQHPSLVKITRKWGRAQHHVNYRIFKKNRLIPNPDYKPVEGVNNYGMELKKIK